MTASLFKKFLKPFWFSWTNMWDGALWHSSLSSQDSSRCFLECLHLLTAYPRKEITLWNGSFHCNRAVSQTTMLKYLKFLLLAERPRDFHPFVLLSTTYKTTLVLGSHYWGVLFHILWLFVLLNSVKRTCKFIRSTHQELSSGEQSQEPHPYCFFELKTSVFHKWYVKCHW